MTSTVPRVPRILFIHNTAVWYRRPFFRRLSQVYDVRFVFTHLQVQRDEYGVDISENIEGMEGVTYRVCKSHLGIPTGLIPELLWGGFELIVDSFGTRWSVPSFLIAKLRRKPILLWSEDWGWRGKSLKGLFIPAVIRFLVSHSDAMLVPGTKHKEYLVSLGGSGEKVFIMPNASNLVIDRNDYQEKERVRDNLHIGANNVVLYVGRLAKQKGVDYLLQAFCRVRREAENVVLLIIGEGECRSELEALSKSLNIDSCVHFIGAVDNEKLVPYYLLCDVCVVPSVSVTHGMGDRWVFVVNEAMLCGKPVIATDAVGAAFDMIKNGVNGFMVPERNVDALYRAMRTVLGDSELSLKMGEESRRMVEGGFTYEHMIAGLKQAVEYVRVVKEDCGR